MPANTGQGIGGRKDQSLIVANATKNASSATSSALRGALNGMLRDILKSIYFIARGVVFVPLNAGEKQ